MSNLLSANFARMKKSKVFWAGISFMAAFGIFITLTTYVTNHKLSLNDLSVENIFFAFAQFIGIAVSLFCSLFIGSEYSDGTIRNKIIIGHQRPVLYLANLITVSVAAILMDIAYLVPCLAIGLLLFQGFVSPASTIITFLLVIFLLTLCFSAIFTLIAMLCQNKALSVAASILTAFILLFTGVYFTAQLNEPETWDAYTYIDASGQLTTDESMPNPNYVSGTKREVYEFLNDFLPGGQQLALSQMRSGTHGLGFFALSSIVITVGTTAAGALCFNKKDLK